MKAYLDNMIASGIVVGDLDQAEMQAIAKLQAREAGGEIKLVTSREAWREQARTQDAAKRRRLESKQDDLPVVPSDHQVQGFQHQPDPSGGFMASPLVSDIFDEPLYNALMNVPAPFNTQHRGYKADIRHLVNAVCNGCDWFVTLDPHLLNRRSDLKPLCRGLRIVRPSELESELAQRP